MKIAILHQDLEWAEKEMQHQFLQKGVEVKLFNINTITEKEILNYADGQELKVINRVYASVANRNYKSNLHALDLLAKFEKRGILCVNSFQTSLFDYDKFKAFQHLKNLGVSTPKTILLKEDSDKTRLIIASFIEKYGFPLILKRNMGGRGKGMKLLNNYAELDKALKFNFSDEQKQIYDYGFVLQEFISSSKNHDVRIGILNNQVVSVMARTLISLNSEKPWLASVSLGSKSLNNYEPSPEEIEIAKKATVAIGATFNIVDLMLTDKGPCIIENNPTPQYIEGDNARERIAILVNLMLSS